LVELHGGDGAYVGIVRIVGIEGVLGLGLARPVGKMAVVELELELEPVELLDIAVVVVVRQQLVEELELLVDIAVVVVQQQLVEELELLVDIAVVVVQRQLVEALLVVDKMAEEPQLGWALELLVDSFEPVLVGLELLVDKMELQPELELELLVADIVAVQQQSVEPVDCIVVAAEQAPPVLMVVGIAVAQRLVAAMLVQSTKVAGRQRVEELVQQVVVPMPLRQQPSSRKRPKSS